MHWYGPTAGKSMSKIYDDDIRFDKLRRDCVFAEKILFLSFLLSPYGNAGEWVAFGWLSLDSHKSMARAQCVWMFTKVTTMNRTTRKLCTEHIMTIKSLFMTTHLSRRAFVYPEMWRIEASRSNAVYRRPWTTVTAKHRWRKNVNGFFFSNFLVPECSRPYLVVKWDQEKTAFHHRKRTYGRGKKDGGMRF